MGGMESSHERLNTLGYTSDEALFSRMYFFLHFVHCAFTVASLEDNAAQTCPNEGESKERIEKCKCSQVFLL